MQLLAAGPQLVVNFEQIGKPKQITAFPISVGVASWNCSGAQLPNHYRVTSFNTVLYSYDFFFVHI